MDIITAIILGIVQGLTEFLPVSSSGHLVIFQTLITPVKESFELLFDITVHLGTLFAVVVYFFKDIRQMMISFVSPLFKPGSVPTAFKGDVYFRISVYILMSTFVTGVIGVLFKDQVEALFTDPHRVALCLIATGFILFISERMHKKSFSLEQFGWKDAVILGLVQAVALMPGISRSGITIAAALILGYAQKEAARYSFLLAVPAIAGAFVLQMMDALHAGFNPDWFMPLLVGLISAAVSGILAIKLILLVLRNKKLYVFSIYCWVIAIVLLVVLNG